MSLLKIYSDTTAADFQSAGVCCYATSTSWLNQLGDPVVSICIK